MASKNFPWILANQPSPDVLAVLIYRTHDISRVLKMIERAAPAAPVSVRNYQPSNGETMTTTFRNLHIEALTSVPLLSYLYKRGIDPDIARQECKEAHYTCHGKAYFAIAFPNEAGGFEIRNPYYKGCIAPKNVSWIADGSHSGTVCLFEGFMDCLSYLTMRKQGRLPESDGQADLLVLNSVHNLPKVLARLKTYKRLYCYLDNDDAGRRVVDMLREIKADAVDYASPTDKKQVGIEIHSGKNRIVRRIFESLGYRVVKLDRVLFAGLTKKNLRRGDWRFLTEQEVNMLRMGAFE